MSDIVEKKAVVQEKAVGTRCDSCGKEVMERYPKGWFNFHHGHQDWCNDSHESIDYFDVCSVDCFKVQLGKSLQEMSPNEHSAEIAEMPYVFAKALYDRL